MDVQLDSLSVDELIELADRRAREQERTALFEVRRGEELLSRVAEVARAPRKGTRAGDDRPKS